MGRGAQAAPYAVPASEADINQSVVAAQYAVRGEVVTKAAELEKKLKGGESLPFDKVVLCNIGNPQALGQKPITFFRQVLSICDYPELLQNEHVSKIYPPDVIKRASDILSNIRGGTGAYSESKGALFLRQGVARSIEKRDGYPCDPDNIFLTDGASAAVHYMTRILLRNKDDAILTPIPQYPLYSAAITLYGGTLTPYYLDESKGWGLNVDHLRDVVAGARKEGKCVRALVVINPGNPTGQCLDEENQKEIVKFCKEEGLVLLADEVYQENIYAAGKKFTSFKKCVRSLGSEYDNFPVVSMQSISKGFYGECGRRGGYMEVCGIAPGIVDQIYKLASVALCSNLNGQICMSLVAEPPVEGEPSYELFMKEKADILASLKRRSTKLVAALNALDGVTCNEAEGAMYAFPCVTLPPKALEMAKSKGVKGDNMYAMRLLEATGIVVVPGSGFGQAEGTFHFRTTFLPSEGDIDSVIERMTKFHQAFMAEFA